MCEIYFLLLTAHVFETILGLLPVITALCFFELLAYLCNTLYIAPFYDFRAWNYIAACGEHEVRLSHFPLLANGHLCLCVGALLVKRPRAPGVSDPLS